MPPNGWTAVTCDRSQLVRNVQRCVSEGVLCSLPSEIGWAAALGSCCKGRFFLQRDLWALLVASSMGGVSAIGAFLLADSCDYVRTALYSAHRHSRAPGPGSCRAPCPPSWRPPDDVVVDCFCLRHTFAHLRSEQQAEATKYMETSSVEFEGIIRLQPPHQHQNAMISAFSSDVVARGLSAARSSSRWV